MIFGNNNENEQDSRAAVVISQSFMNTASYVEIFRGTEESRKEVMEFVFRRNLYMVRQKCPESIRCITDSEGNVVCFFMLVPSFAAHSSLFEKIVVGGIIELAFWYGFDILKRLIRIADFSDAMEKDLMKGRRYYSLQRMVVAPALQGKGLGSRYLGEALREADRNQLPVVLSTQDSRNLVYYSRLGFEQVRQVEYKVPEGDDDKYNYTSYFMVREPRQQKQQSVEGAALTSTT